MEVWFLGCEVAEMLDFSGFDDMGYDNIFIWIKIEFYLILLGFEDIDKVKFWRRSVDESAIGFAAFPVLLVSFYYPQLVKNIQ